MLFLKADYRLQSYVINYQLCNSEQLLQLMHYLLSTANIKPKKQHENTLLTLFSGQECLTERI